MKIRPQDQEFRNPKVFYPDPKNIDLDRVLVNLFLLLRCEGQRPATAGRQQRQVESVEYHAEQLAQMDGVTGFDTYKEIAKRWLECDIFDLVNRGGVREAIASLRPLHLDAPKIRVAKHCRDYNHADAIYAFLDHGDRQALLDLKAYLDRGRDAGSQHPDAHAHVDLDTLTVIKLVEGLRAFHPSGAKLTASPPVCRGQARLLCDDVQRLLAYRDAVPRPVMIDYLKTVMGLHLGLYVLRLRRQLSGWIKDKKPHATCLNCPVYGSSTEAAQREHDPFRECPYPVTVTVDMGASYRSRMAQVAQASAANEYGQLSDFVRSIFAVNQLLRYAREEKGLGIAEDPAEVMRLLASPPEGFEADFRARLKELRRENESEDESLPPEVEAILQAGLPAFDTFIEVVTHVRQKHHTGYLTQDLDKLFQKNTDWGAMVQGRSKGNPRRWHLGGRLLEVLVQLSVLRFEDTATGRRFYSEDLLVDDFLHWVERRYGFVIGPSITSDELRPVTLDETRAYRENVIALKNRLREIGFYDDLSDAFNAQRIRPRYPIGHEEPER
jgi:hypothetical protein